MTSNDRQRRRNILRRYLRWHKTRTIMLLLIVLYYVVILRGTGQSVAYYFTELIHYSTP